MIERGVSDHSDCCVGSLELSRPSHRTWACNSGPRPLSLLVAFDESVFLDLGIGRNRIVGRLPFVAFPSSPPPMDSTDLAQGGAHTRETEPPAFKPANLGRIHGAKGEGLAEKRSVDGRLDVASLRMQIFGG